LRCDARGSPQLRLVLRVVRRCFRSH
jgi:hypothetical protein